MANEKSEQEEKTSAAPVTKAGCCCGGASEQTIQFKARAGGKLAGSESITFQIEGMECGCEGALIERKMNGLAGVTHYELNAITHQLRVSYDSAHVTIQDIVRSVSETGMKASQVKRQQRHSAWWREKQQLALYCCGLLALIAFTSEKLGAAHLVSTVIYILSVLTGVFYPARKALVAAINLTPTIHLLMLIGSVGAMLLGLWGEAAVLIFVYSLGDVLESYAVDKARGAIRSLMELMPREALVRASAGEEVRMIEKVLVGDIVIVRPGERIPVDGTVVHGLSYIDQAAITGEPIPVRREVGGEVFAGTINQNGSLEVRVTKPASEAMLSRIICSVEEAQAKKTSLQRFADDFGKYYTPAMFVLGVLVAVVPPLFWGAAWMPFIYRGLVVFVVSCSCGLALSVPVAVVAAMANAARKGVVFKGGAYLESVNRVKVIAFDKTGTLTIGRPQVTDVLGVQGAGEQEVLSYASAVESRSGHPLAAAIVRKAKEAGAFSARGVEGFHESTGRGVSASVDGHACMIGSPRSLVEHGIAIDAVANELERLENEGKTVVVIATDGQLKGLMAISDTVRPGALEALQRLKRAGVKTAMLTGDNERSARAIAQMVGIDEYYAQLLPTDKVAAIKKLREKHGPVAMVGDGINDAPAMAVSDVGIAMGAAGTDIAIEAGDVVLMSDDLGKIGFVQELSSRTVSTIRQNILISLVNVAFMVVMALLGYLALVTGLLLNEGSALFVIVNALRLLKWKVANKEIPEGVRVVEQGVPESLSLGKPQDRCLVVAEPAEPANSDCCCASPELEESSASSGSCCGGENEIHSAAAGVLESAVFRVDGICGCEGHVVEKRVKALKGMRGFSLNPITNQMKLTFDSSLVSTNDILDAVKKAGGTAVMTGPSSGGGAGHPGYDQRR